MRKISYYYTFQNTESDLEQVISSRGGQVYFNLYKRGIQLDTKRVLKQRVVNDDEIIHCVLFGVINTTNAIGANRTE